VKSTESTHTDDATLGNPPMTTQPKPSQDLILVPGRPPKNPMAFSVFVAGIFMAISFLVYSLLINHIQIRDEVNQAPTRRVQDLVTLLSQAESRQRQLEKESEKLRERLTILQDHPEYPSLDPASLEYQQLLSLSGLAPLHGPGIIVTLTEGTNSVQGNPSKRLSDSKSNIQSDDLLKLVNDLRAAGAKGIAINDQRLVTSSEVVNAGPSIVVNQSRLSGPIVIRALGDPALLRSSLSIRGGILEYLEFFGIKANIKDVKDVELPAYTIGNSPE